METRTDEKLLEKVTAKWREHTGSKKFSLPFLLGEEDAGKTVTMIFSSMDDFYSHNMQENNAAFEAWALAIYVHYLDECGNVRLDIRPEDFKMAKQKERSLDYNRFLYRALRFSEQYGKWFSLSERLEELTGCFITQLDRHKFTNNVPGKTSGLSEPTKNEKKMEWLFSDDAHGKTDTLLKKCLGVDKVHHHLPVGLFDVTDNPKCMKCSEENSVFPGKGAAIDLWATDGTALKILELKAMGKEANDKVGAVTELFFYANYVYDMFVEKNNAFCKRKAPDVRGYGEFSDSLRRVEAYLLLDAKSRHPLMDRKVLNILNGGTNGAITYACLIYNCTDDCSDITEIRREI